MLDYNPTKAAIFYSRLIYGNYLMLVEVICTVHVHLAYNVYIQCVSYINVLSIVVVGTLI